MDAPGPMSEDLWIAIVEGLIGMSQRTDSRNIKFSAQKDNDDRGRNVVVRLQIPNWEVEVIMESISIKASHGPRSPQALVTNRCLAIVSVAPLFLKIAIWYKNPTGLQGRNHPLTTHAFSTVSLSQLLFPCS